MPKKMSIEIINPNAAGIDVGSRTHHVAIGHSLEDVREFGVYDEDLNNIAQWLLGGYSGESEPPFRSN